MKQSTRPSRHTEQRRADDAKRRKLQPWRRWYFTKRWKERRRLQLERVPWCEPCKRLGKSRIATIANHKIPHRGDEKLFFEGELESACKNCHDQAIQREEIEGASREIDLEGWPTDPRHLFNQRRGGEPLQQRRRPGPKET